MTQQNYTRKNARKEDVPSEQPLRILDYRVERSEKERYSGAIEMETTRGRRRVCFEASNFLLYMGEFFNMNSCPMDARDYNEMELKISQNGVFIPEEEMEEIRRALGRVIIVR